MSRWMKKLFGLTLIFLLFFCYCFWVYLPQQKVVSNDSNNHEAVFYNFTKKHDMDNHAALSPSLYYCNIPDHLDIFSFQEGKGKPGWSLKQVQVLIRHGDRTPLKMELYYQRNIQPNFCNIYDQENYVVKKFDVLEQYRNAISRQYLNSLKKSNSYTNQIFTHPLPQSILCGSGQLTNLGVVQHLHNGFLLRELYMHKHKLINLKNLQSTAKVFTTHFSRTLQSAVAFLYGLIPDYKLSQVPVEISNTVIFCGNNCYCPYARSDNVDKPIKSLQYQTYIKRQKDNFFIRKIADTVPVGDRTGAQIDALVTGFLCKNLKLPCNASGDCVTENDLNAVMKEQEYMNRHLSEDSPLRNQSMLEMQPLLERMLFFMGEKVTGAKSALNLVVFSGHDSTLRPMLEALFIPDYRWPRLASRLVFELWEGNKKHYIKIYYNGMDVTSKLIFCPDDSMDKGCPLSNFQHYILHGIGEHFGFKSRTEACAAT